MVLNKLSIMGNPNIGVYVFANDKIAIIPPGLSDYEKNILTETLNVELIETKVAGTIINGVMLAGNNKGIILPRNVLDDEYTILSKELKKHGIETAALRSKVTALGNIFLVNDNIAIVGSEFNEKELEKIEEVLGVKAVIKDIMGLVIPGSLAVVTNNGGVIHPDVSDVELYELKELLGFYLERATVNSGVPFIKTGLVANTYGVVVGELTTGPEILRIQKGLRIR